MTDTLRCRAESLMDVLRQLPGVKNCTLYGSLRENRADDLSDIDIEVDVSGTDNGAFMLALPEMLGEKLPIFYFDYAPSLAPQQYVVSIALDEENPFLMADLKCVAHFHCTSVTRAELHQRNDPYAHVLKLWTANVKHFVRKTECTKDIRRMAARIGVDQPERWTDAELLQQTLDWLEANAPSHLKRLANSCRREASIRLFFPASTTGL